MEEKPKKIPIVGKSDPRFSISKRYSHNAVYNQNIYKVICQFLYHALSEFLQANNFAKNIIKRLIIKKYDFYLNNNLSGSMLNGKFSCKKSVFWISKIEVLLMELLKNAIMFL